ncbi:hypothetical protein SSBR45G_72450 [Bradyrhizobium sp. SSBR45G]|uniref:hypothetical protein n=1 Tax=unclassified Bradyrhizobium TaxID=2631580 RepID=UPI002342AEA0|nr:MULTISPECIES: hypothetical protein [unclassified Bradyrhizobium]GLH82336.1 hypothetical protein SSBR45G_72450 [Bradyrhizobium sp. SSBR45G]GLH89763.1 hypothetical protein SSBR45R_72240 [Bradyrhizobium sp. SSBR45R]
MAVVEQASATSTNPQTASKSFPWTLTSYEEQGNLWLKWTTGAPFRAQQGQIAVYNNGFPADPQKDRKAWSWDNEHGGGSGWDTGLRYGSDWSCAWIAEKSPNGPYTYVVTLVTKGI